MEASEKLLIIDIKLDDKIKFFGISLHHISQHSSLSYIFIFSNITFFVNFFIKSEKAELQINFERKTSIFSSVISIMLGRIPPIPIPDALRPPNGIQSTRNAV